MGESPFPETYLILHEKLGRGLGRDLSRSVAVSAGGGRRGIALRLHEHVVLELLLEGRLLGLEGLLEDVQLLAGETSERTEAQLVLQKERTQWQLVLERG